MDNDRLKFLRSTNGYKIATSNKSQQEILNFEQEYLTLSPIAHAGIAGNYVIGTNNNLSKFVLTIGSIVKVYLLNEKRNAAIMGLTYFSKTHRFLVLEHIENGNLRETRITLKNEDEESAIQKFAAVLKTKNSNIKLGAG